MRKINFFIASITCGFLVIISNTNCSKENKETAFACDSTNVSYSATIKPLLSNQCNSCHSTASASTLGGGTILDTYTDLVNYVDTSNLMDTAYTIANSNLYSSVARSSNPMPKNGTPLSLCDKSKIKNWILAGAKNN